MTQSGTVKLIFSNFKSENRFVALLISTHHQYAHTASMYSYFTAGFKTKCIAFLLPHMLGEL